MDDFEDQVRDLVFRYENGDLTKEEDETWQFIYDYGKSKVFGPYIERVKSNDENPSLDNVEEFYAETTTETRTGLIVKRRNKDG